MTARSTFAALRRPAGRSRSGPLSVRFAPLASPAGRPQLAWSIPKTCGGAVVRNRIRRRLRSAARDIKAQLSPGAYLVHTDPEVIHMTYAQLIHSLSESTSVAAARGGASRA